MALDYRIAAPHHWALVVCLCMLTPTTARSQTFGSDLDFLRKHTDVVVLAEPSGEGQVAVVPEYQGRVMTSTAAGLDGTSFGWINRTVVADGKQQPHINVFGGEDRFWLGPEGGQYSIFFRPNAEFTLDTWQTPEPLDWGAWPVVSQTRRAVHFRRSMKLQNYSGSEFQVQVNRRVRVLSRDELAKKLAVPLPAEVRAVAYESENAITNTGSEPWRKSTGLLSVWILGMFQHSPQTTVVVPFRQGPVEDLGPIVNDRYFGAVPKDRLRATSGHLFFRGDGLFRSKIGVGPRRAKPTLGSYAAEKGQLTIVQFSIPEGARDYVNSMWEIQQHPYAGDVVNSYNDGPPSPGAKPLGPFYELESSSPAAALAPAESLVHVHRTIHLQGPETILSTIAQQTLGVTAVEIRNAFSAR